MSAHQANYLQQDSIKRLLHRFLDKLDRLGSQQREQRVIEKIQEKYFPELFNPQHADDDSILWHDLQQLELDNIIKIEQTKSRLPVDTPIWEYARVIFNLDYEDKLRECLDRPVQSEYARAWFQAVQHHHACFDKPELLATPLFENWGKPAAEIVQRFAKIPELLKRKSMTLYQLSATLFWAHSKLLKDREQWLQELFALDETQILARPLLLDISYPQTTPKGILLIENLDSYHAAVSGLWQDCNDLILIYTQGFKIAAHRIRNSNCTRFHINSVQLPEPNIIKHFEACWFGQIPFSYPLYMITDLDWSGLAIYVTTQQSLPLLQPWLPGYQQMLAQIKQGNYHLPQDAGKSEQHPITSTGNEWLDIHVLPLLAQDCFVDQEIII